MKVFHLKYLSIFSIMDIVAVIDFLKYKNLENVIMFNCLEDSEAINVQKIFKFNSIRNKILNLNNNSSSTIINSYFRIGILVNTSCGDWKQINKLFNSNTIGYQYPFIWVYFTENLTSVNETVSKHPIEVDADVTIFYKTNKLFRIFDVYNTGPKNNGMFKINEIGAWNSFLMLKSKEGRLDLSGVVLKSSVVIVNKIVNETFEEYLRQARQTGLDSVHKLKFFILLKYIRDMYNLTYDLQRTNTWGYSQNGSMDGLAGTLQRHETDIGGSPLFFKVDRAWVLDYAAEVWPSRQSFFFRHPKYPSGFYTIYTRPLSVEVWYCILSLLLLSGVILCIMLKVKLHDSGILNDTSSSLAFLFVLGAICQQGISVAGNSSAVKVFVFIIFISSVTLYQYYNATVVSTLLRDSPVTIRSLENLLHSNLKAGVEDVPYNKDYFKRTTDPVSIQMYRKKIVAGNKLNFFNPEHGMALVKHGGFAFHVDSVISYSIMKKTFSEREICETRDVTMYPPQKMGAVVKQRSPYKNHIAYSIRKMWESGVMHRLKTIWDEPKPSCVQTPDSSIFSVTITEFSSPLLLLIFGIIFSVLILMGEILISKITERNRITFAQ